ncbi:MAG: hypothetical protein V8R67_03060 [Eubacterium sp.]
MSFSRKVKEELGGQVSRARHCQIAELAALFSCCGHVVSQGERNFFVKFTTENLTVAKKYSILIKKAFHFDIEMSVRGHQYLIYILNPEDALVFLQALKSRREKHWFMNWSFSEIAANGHLSAVFFWHAVP